jgi:hypothetical protein
VAAAFAKELLKYVQPSEVDGQLSVEEILSQGKPFSSSLCGAISHYKFPD